MELYNKYRPKTFGEVVGNEIAKKALLKELENGSRVFLLTGAAGCGKTTLARIMASHVGANPSDIREINSANNRGIDTAREIIEDMRYRPMAGEASVWIIDECHAMTSANMNAFLTPLENVPEYCYFFLCTTDPQKLIAPLKSRCSVVNVSPLTEKEMVPLLLKVAKAEGVRIQKEVCARIFELSGGSGRTALKLLAKVLHLDEGERLDALRREGAGEECAETIEFCRALMKCRTLPGLLPSLRALDLSNAESIRQAVMGYMGAVILKGGVSANAVCAMQAFGSADTYRNGKNAIVIAALDFCEMMSN